MVWINNFMITIGKWVSRGNSSLQASLQSIGGGKPAGFKYTRTAMLLLAGLFAMLSCTGQPSQPQAENAMLYAKNNLIAWCIVPFDTENRDPAERAALLNELGFTRMAWDWRMEHLPQLSEEISVLRNNDINLTAVWLWLDNRSSEGLLDHHDHILNIIAEQGVETTLWVSFDNDFFAGLPDEEKVMKGAWIIDKVHSRAAGSGSRVALYNHGDWFGEPEN
jgi:hypothetical protein